MKRTAVLSILVLTLAIAMTVGLSAQSSVIMWFLAGDEAAHVECSGESLQVMNHTTHAIDLNCVPIPTATNTPVPTPTNTPVPSQPSNEPFAGAPECTQHDPTAWHSLWNAELGCHYDHEHKHDPSVTDYIFGPALQTFGAPWATMNENANKHEGYGWLVLQDEEDINKASTDPKQYEVDCRRWNVGDSNTKVGCVVAARARVHAVGSSKDSSVRFHSYYIDLLLCSKDGICGRLSTGGHGDTGPLCIPYPGGQCVYVDQGPATDGTTATGKYAYRSHTSHPKQPGEIDNFLIWIHGGANSQHNKLVQLGIQSYDIWGGTDPSNPHQVHVKCPDGSCPYNTSTMKIFKIQVKIPSGLPVNSNGRLNYTGYTDLAGNIAPSCTAEGPNCVPLVINGLLPTVTSYAYNIRSFIDGTQNVIGVLPEYDIAPQGEHWIQYQ